MALFAGSLQLLALLHVLYLMCWLTWILPPKQACVIFIGGVWLQRSPVSLFLSHLRLLLYISRKTLLSLTTPCACHLSPRHKSSPCCLLSFRVSSDHDTFALFDVALTSLGRLAVFHDGALCSMVILLLYDYASKC